MANPNSEGADLSLQTMNPRAFRVPLALFTNLADITGADLLTAWTPGFNGRILSMEFFVEKPATTAAKLATLTPKINATNVTGGAVALTSANCTPQGARVAGSAVTAGFTFTPTDTIGIVGSGVTAFIEGGGWIILTMANDDLRTTLALAVGVPPT